MASTTSTDSFEERIARLEQGMLQLAKIKQQVDELSEHTPRNDKVTLVLFSGELDKVLASLIIATTAVSMGMEVMVFFTFWGINVLKEKRIIEHKKLLEKMIDIMTPVGPESMPVSQMNMLGAGAALLKRMMKDKDVVTAHELLEVAQESGVKMNVCTMTMQVMGIKKEELMSDIEMVGAATYLREATRSGLTLFI